MVSKPKTLLKPGSRVSVQTFSEYTSNLELRLVGSDHSGFSGMELRGPEPYQHSWTHHIFLVPFCSPTPLHPKQHSTPHHSWALLDPFSPQPRDSLALRGETKFLGFASPSCCRITSSCSWLPQESQHRQNTLTSPGRN